MDDDIVTAIELAQKRLVEAQRELDVALAAIRVARRAEKVTVSRAVELALDQLRSAQALLADLTDADAPAAGE
jgi:hypothetical protein